MSYSIWNRRKKSLYSAAVASPASDCSTIVEPSYPYPGTRYGLPSQVRLAIACPVTQQSSWYSYVLGVHYFELSRIDGRTDGRMDERNTPHRSPSITIALTPGGN